MGVFVCNTLRRLHFLIRRPGVQPRQSGSGCLLRRCATPTASTCRSAPTHGGTSQSDSRPSAQLIKASHCVALTGVLLTGRFPATPHDETHSTESTAPGIRGVTTCGARVFFFSIFAASVNSPTSCVMRSQQFVAVSTLCVARYFLRRLAFSNDWPVHHHGDSSKAFKHSSRDSGIARR